MKNDFFKPKESPETRLKRAKVTIRYHMKLLCILVASTITMLGGLVVLVTVPLKTGHDATGAPLLAGLSLILIVALAYQTGSTINDLRQARARYKRTLA